MPCDKEQPQLVLLRQAEPQQPQVNPAAPSFPETERSRRQGEDDRFSSIYLTTLVHKPAPRDRKPGTLPSAERQSPPENKSKRLSQAPAMNHNLYLSLSVLTAHFGSSDNVPEAKRANSE